MKKIYLLSTLLLIMSSVIVRFGGATTVAVNFDSMFPATPYKMALDTCMHMYGDLEAWVHALSTQEDEHGQLMCAEILVGRLVNLQQVIAAMLKKQPKILAEDGHYLVMVLQQMQDQAQSLVHGLPKERASQVTTLFTAIKKNLEKLEYHG